MYTVNFFKITRDDRRYLSELGYQLKRPRSDKVIEIRNLSSNAFVKIFYNDEIHCYGPWTIHDMNAIIQFLNKLR